MLSSCSFGVLNVDFFLKQLLWVITGLVMCGLVANLDYRRLDQKGVAWALFAIMVVCLGLVLIPGVGHKANGARRWLFGFQPSEFAKPALVIVLAHYCTSNLARIRERTAGFLRPMALIGLISGLVFLQPDWGTAGLIAIVGTIMLAFAGTRLAFLLIAWIIASEIFFIALCRDSNRLARVVSFLDPERSQDSITWQPWNGILALGCGDWTGVGLGDGRLKMGFIPEHHTDFILPVIGEELGLAGTWGVVFAFMWLVACGIRIAWRAPDAFGQFLAAGITFSIGWQALINIGAATSTIPNKGMPLPFISYGGSSMISTLMSVGLLISIARTFRSQRDSVGGLRTVRFVPGSASASG